MNTPQGLALPSTCLIYFISIVSEQVRPSKYQHRHCKAIGLS